MARAMATKRPKTPKAPAKKAGSKPPTPEQGHKQRFEQLLDDAVLGVPPPKR